MDTCAIGVLGGRGQLVRHMLLFKEYSLDTLKAMSATFAVVAHISKPPYQVFMKRSPRGKKIARAAIWDLLGVFCTTYST